MADGSAPDWRSVDREFPPPLEREFKERGIVVVYDSSPAAPLLHDGAVIQDTVSEYTLRASGIGCAFDRPLDEIQDLAGLSQRDPIGRQRNKDARRKRVRPRIVRDGNAPQLDPTTYPPDHVWAVTFVNFITLKRYSPPEVERTGADGRPYGATTWLKEVAPELRRIGTWIFRHVARHGGGSDLGKKFEPRTIVEALVLSNFPENMQIEGDAPTPISEGSRLAACQSIFAFANSEASTTKDSASHEPTKLPIQNHAASA